MWCKIKRKWHSNERATFRNQLFLKSQGQVGRQGHRGFTTNARINACTNQTSSRRSYNKGWSFNFPHVQHLFANNLQPPTTNKLAGTVIANG